MAGGYAFKWVLFVGDGGRVFGFVRITAIVRIGVRTIA